MPFLNTFGASSAKSFGHTRKKGSSGVTQYTYIVAGTYSATVPVGATKMSILLVDSGGSGGGGSYSSVYFQCPCYLCNIQCYSRGRGGSGGAGAILKYKNCIAVSAGQTLSVTVAAAPAARGPCAGYLAVCANPSSVTLAGSPITGFTTNSNLFYGGSGSSGGVNTVSPSGFPAPTYGGKGGGAGGYSGSGGNACANPPTANSGAAAGGGGVGIYGRGANGSISGVRNGSVCGGRSAYGAGGDGGSVNCYSGNAGYKGGDGAVRLLFTNCSGPTRQYPATNTGDL